MSRLLLKLVEFFGICVMINTIIGAFAVITGNYIYTFYT